jgi:hypothetical protein
VTERPGNQVSVALKISVPFLHSGAVHLLNSLHDIARKTWLFRNYNRHFDLFFAIEMSFF